MESLAERYPVSRALHLSNFPVCEHPPDFRFPSVLKGPIWREMPYPDPFLTQLLGSPVKEIPLPRPSPWSLFKDRGRERCFIPRAPFIHLSKSLVDEPSSRFSSGAPIERDACLQRIFYISFRVPSKGALPPGFLHRASRKKDAPSSESLSTISQSPC
jgi:hypothetical protein